METHMPLEITANRMPKLNKNFLKFWRGNHDVTVLDDSGNKMQYATTYVSKYKHTELMDDGRTEDFKMFQYLNVKSFPHAMLILVIGNSAKN